MAKLILNNNELSCNKAELIQAKSTTQTATAPITFTGEASVIRGNSNDGTTQLILYTAPSTTVGARLYLGKSNASSSALKGRIMLHSRATASTVTTTNFALYTNVMNYLSIGDYVLSPVKAATVGSAESPAHALASSTDDTSLTLAENPSHQYIHQVLWLLAASGRAIRVDIINSSKDEINTQAKLAEALYNGGYRTKATSIPCSGWWYSSASSPNQRVRYNSVWSPSTTDMRVWFYKNAESASIYSSASSLAVYDNVLQLN